MPGPTAKGSEANPLGLSLGFIEGMALVSLRDRTVANGLIIRALDLELLDVKLPLDLQGGAESFQQYASRLRTLVVDLSIEALARLLQAGLTAVGSAVRKLQLRPDAGALALEAELVLDDRRARIAGQLAIVPGDRDVKVVILDLLELGYFPVSAVQLPAQIEAAIRDALAPAGERAAETLRRSGIASLSIDVVDAIVWGLIPRSGWKVPRHDEAPLHAIEIRPDGFIRLEVGDLSAVSAEAAARAKNKRELPAPLLRALGRDDAGRVSRDAERRLADGDLTGAFADMREKLDASFGPDVLAERALSLGSSEPALFADASDLARDILAARADSVAALVALARIATYEGDLARAFEHFEKAARLLREGGRKRPAGFAYLAAARAAQAGSADRVRVLEEAIALLPDDVEALAGLVEELPALGRATAAVRAARRLANLAETPVMRVRAHVVAGDLLRGPLADPVQAKREYERALKIAPDDEQALEGLARAVMDQGEPRRAATLFEKLIQNAEAEGQKERAAKLSMVLGDLWRELDPEAAIVRYRHAVELTPRNVAVLSRLARTATDAGRNEVALAAIEQALPLLEESAISLGQSELLEMRLRAGAILERQPARVRDAIAHYEAALAIDAQHPDALVALADLYGRTKDDVKRADVLGRHADLAASAGDLDTAAHLWGEQAQLVAGDPGALREVRRALNAAAAKDRRHRGLLDRLVDVSELEGDAAAIVEAIDRRLLIDDGAEDRAALLVRLGAAHERAGRISEAARAYEESLGRVPGEPRAIAALTRIYRGKKDHERLATALEHAAEIAESSDERAKALAERARLLSDLGRDGDAFDAAMRAIAEGPEPDFFPFATQLALRAGHFEEAKELAERRFLIASQSGDRAELLQVHVDLARAAEGLGDPNGLIAALYESLSLSDLAAEEGRQLAARLARELYRAGRQKELAELQRRRAEVREAPPTERAERWIDAARIASRLDQERQAELDVRNALGVLEEGSSRELESSALDVLEGLVRRQGAPTSPPIAEKLSEILGRRARTAIAPRDKERLRLEQASVLEKAGLEAIAVKALEEASDELPSSIEIARALGGAAERAGQIPIAASSFGRAARIAEKQGDDNLAIEMHGRAAQACAAMQDTAYQVTHDRALLVLCPPGSTSPWLAKAVDRLEEHARAGEDWLLLVEVISRRAASAAPAVAARLLLDKAEIELTSLANDRAALDSLQRARELAPEGSEVAETVADQLVRVLAKLGQHSERANVLVERADKATDPERQSKLYFEAAEVYAGELQDRPMALSRAQAAIRAWPQNEPARKLRLLLLREGGRKEALVDALADEGAMSKDAREAAHLWVEAADILVPLGKVDAGHWNRLDLERALDLVRKAAAATPTSPEPLRAAVAYTRGLGRADEEFVALEQLVEREVRDPERVAAYLRRVDLLRGPLEDPTAALAELEVALALLDGVDEVGRAQVLPLVREETRTALQLEGRPLIEAVLRAGIRLSEETTDWASHVKYLLRLVDLAEDVEVRADLRTQAGEVLEWKLGDGAGAEREYRAALALRPDHERSRTALRSFYIAVDRFGDLAENLGVDALREVWRKIRAVEAPARVVAAGEALWPMLEEGEAERADVQLALADLYTTERDDAEQAVHVLEQVVKTAPLEHQNKALERLSVLFLEKERFDLYVDVLRRQSERISGDKARALAISDLGDALEWKLGDGAAAEREYRAALAIDPECPSARTRLELLLSSQDRFAEIGRDLGAQVLAERLDQLIRLGRREHDRAWAAAEALAVLLELDQRGTMWLRYADRLRNEPEEKAALLRAGAEPGREQARALDRLIVLLEEQKDWPLLVNTLRQRVNIEPEDPVRLELHYRLGALLCQLADEEHGAGREALESEAERELVAALTIDPRHTGARVLLETLYVSRGRLLEVGRTLGLETLASVRDRAQSDGDRQLLANTVAALAELSAGEARAGYLVELVELTGEGSLHAGDKLISAESLYRAALEAHEANVAAREGLRALYESEGRYKDIAQVLGTGALRDTLEQLERLEDRAGQLPAALALAHALEVQGGDARERAELLLDISKLQLGEDDAEAAEHALREALALLPSHPLAREEIRQLLVAQDRLHELADIDEALLAHTGKLAAEEGDLDLEVRVLSVLAARSDGERRADTLVLIAALEKKRGDERAAEARLRDALAVMAEHKLARAELEAILWAEERFTDLHDALGAGAVIARARAGVENEPDRALAALGAIRAAVEGAVLAEALELSASIALADEGDRERRLEDLVEARAIHDALGGSGRERVRVAIALLRREMDDADALLEALEDASRFAESVETRSRLAVERATLLVLSDRKEEARALVEPVAGDESAPIADRAAAARMLADDLIGRHADDLELDDLELKARCLELLAIGDARDVYPEDRVRWLLALATAREALGAGEESIAGPLEDALANAKDRDEVLAIRRRLRELYEQLGDWQRAEAHASVIADADDRPELWVGLSELRVWLDDRDGAKVALERALTVDSSFGAAHSALLRLAEQEGRTDTVIDRLEAWADNDRDGPRLERAERMLRASSLGAEIGDAERASRLAERALEIVPQGDEQSEALAMRAIEILEPLEQHEALVAILSRVVGSAPPSLRSSELRLRLADTLIALARDDEAATVIEQGVQRLTPDDDPLIERLVGDARAATTRGEGDAAARRLLRIADRLGSGPTARRLRLVGAECAEAAGELVVARGAWSTIAGEVGVGDEGARARRSLLRLARAIDDPAGLVTALVDAADDAPTQIERASLLGEAAQHADRALGDADRAEALLVRALASDPDNEALRQTLLDFLQAHGRWAALDDELDARAAKLPTGPEKAALLARIGANARDHLHDDDRAADMLRRAYELERSLGVGTALERGRAAVEALIRAERFSEAASFAARVERENSGEDNPRVLLALLLLRAEALERDGAVENAVEALMEAKRRAPASELVEARLVDLLLRHERWRDLAGVLDGFAEKVEPSSGVRHRLAAARILLDRAGDPRAAAAMLESAMSVADRWLSDPDATLPDQVAGGLDAHGIAGGEASPSSAPLLDLAAMAKEVGAHTLRVDALRLRAQTLPVGPAQWSALLSLAGAEREARDLDAAEFTLRGVVEAVRGADVSARDRTEAELALGALLLERGKAEEAASVLAAAAELARGVDPRLLVRALAELARAHRGTDRADLAVAALAEARALDPGVIAEAELEAVIEAAGPSERLARLWERRALEERDPARRARCYREAADLWEQLGDAGRALGPRVEAYRIEPQSRAEGQELEEKLYRAERWSDLEALQARRLEVEDLSDGERVALLSSRARVLSVHLGQPKRALEALQEARELVPKSREVLSAIAELAAELDLDDVRQDALARVATITRTPPLSQAILSERAFILEKSGDLAGAVQCLEEAIDGALTATKQAPVWVVARHPRSWRDGTAPRSLVERLSAIYARREHWASCARLWVRVADASSGNEAAAALSRAGHIRLEALGDRRGAMAALEAASRQSPNDLSIRRALLELASALGDLGKARTHVRAAVDAAKRAGEDAAWFAFTLEEARIASALGDRATALSALSQLVEARPDYPRLLEHVVARVRDALDAEKSVQLLRKRVLSLPAGPLRGKYRLAIAQLLEEPLARKNEAETERRTAEREDFPDEPGKRTDPKFVAPTESQDILDEYRTSRPVLDRSGRWTELAHLEEKRAAVLADPIARSNALVEVGRLYTEKRNEEAEGAGETGALKPRTPEERTSRARDAFMRALRAYPDNVDALARLAKLEVEAGEWERAAPVFEHLERLGGPAWAVARFELLGAEVAEKLGLWRLRTARLLRARDRDPASREALRALAGIGVELPPANGDASVRERWLAEYEAVLDPMSSGPELARIWELRAELAIARGAARDALLDLAHALEIDPERSSARRLRLELLGREPPSRLLADALLEEAAASGDREAELLARALETALAVGDTARAAHAASRLERAPGLGPEQLELLVRHAVETSDGERLVRIADRAGGLEAVRKPDWTGRRPPPGGGPTDVPRSRVNARPSWPRELDVRLAAAYLGADRAREACALLVSFLPEGDGDLEPFASAVASALSGTRDDAAPQTSGAQRLRAPALQARLRGLFFGLLHEAGARPLLVRLLEGLHRVLPDDRAIAGDLARAHREDGDEARAVEILRALLADDPLDVERVAALAEALIALGDHHGAAGPAAVAALLGRPVAGVESPLAPITAPLPAASVRAHLTHPAARSDLGELLALTSGAVAAVLPPGPAALAERVPGEDDPRIGDLVAELAREVARPLQVSIDPEGAHRVSIEPGDPPSIVVGEALVADAPASELRFHLARAAMLLELGYLVVERATGPMRRNLIDMVLAATDPESSSEVAPDLRVAIDAVRERLGPTGLANAEPIASRIRENGGRETTELGAWMYGAIATANRFGLLASGDIEAAIRALRRSDPRTFGARWDAPESRRAALERSAPLLDLVRFVLGADYDALAREGREAEQHPSRF